MKKYAHLLITLASLGLLLIGGSLVWGQSDDPVAPQVIGVQPFPGEEMPLDSALTVIFNQAMDQASVESAWQVTPALEGTFSWSDERTLQFTPAQGWGRGQQYQIALTSTASAQNGLTLAEDYDFNARAVGFLEVASVIPADGVEGISADATITIAFNRPVVPLGSTEQLDDLPNPLSIEPALEGQGEWLNTSIYTFTPSQALLGGATYRVTVKAGLTDVVGALLESDYVFSFQTLAPEVLSSNPSPNEVGFLLDSPISLQFSQPMDQASTAAGFVVRDERGEPVAGQTTWSEDGTQLIFTPDERLSIASNYSLRLEASSAKGLGGAAVREGRDFIFRTVELPFVRETYPNTSQTDVTPGVIFATFYFGTPMEPNSMEGKYRIEPDPGEIMAYANPDSLALQFTALKNTRYSVTLLAGAEDIYGNRLENDFSFTFTTGEPEPYAYLNDTGRFIVTGAYRENTAISLYASGQPRVLFGLYNLPVQDLSTFIWNGYYDETVQNTLANPQRLVRAWDQTFDESDGTRNVSVNLADKDGGALPLGMYFVLSEFNQSGYNNRMPVALAVVNSTVNYKRAQDDILVWVTDMQSGAPLPDQTVRIHSGTEVIATGQTDAEGVLRLSLDPGLGNGFLAISSESSGKFGIWYNSYGPGQPEADTLYIYTDRPIYRPGETVYFRGVYRLRDDVTYSINPARTTVTIMADTNYGERILFDQALTLNDFGTFSGEFVIPEDAPIGYLRIFETSGIYGEVGAQIAEFRVPEFAVEVTPSQDEVTNGNPTNVLVKGSFYAGGGVGNAPLTWYAEANPVPFAYTGPGRYSFSNQQYFWFGYGGGGYPRTIGSGEGVTASDGSYVIALDEAQMTTAGPSPETVMLEATLTEESGQFISNRSYFLLHSSEVYVGVRTSDYFGEAGKPFTAEVLTVDQASEVVPNQAVTLQLIEYRWERTPVEGQFGQYTWEVKEIEVESVRVTTDAAGQASHDFTPPNGGIFYVRAQTLDRLERPHLSSAQIWVTGNERVWWGEPSTSIELIADKDSYSPGESAQILIPVSLEGKSQLLIALERDGVMRYEVIEVEGSTYVYDLPIEDSFSPTIHVSMMLVHGIDEANPVPVYRSGSIALSVQPLNRLIDLTITPSQRNAQPGDTITLEVQATNPDGSPAQAEIGLAMVDQAILSLAVPNSGDPKDFFYGFASNYTVSDSMLTGLIDGRQDEIEEQEQLRQEEADRSVVTDGVVAQEAAADAAGFVANAAPAPTMTATGGGGGGGGGFEAVTVREDFQQTPLWVADLVTNSDGLASVQVTLPDNLTEWYILGRGVTRETLVGADELFIRSTLPLLVRPATPRFFVVGDEVTLGMVVNNNTDAAQTVRTTMQGTGYELLEGETLEQEVTIESGGRARVNWRVKILDVTGVDVTFIALGADGYQDAAKPTLRAGEGDLIPVYRYTAPDTVGTGGVLLSAGGVTEGVSIPPFADSDQGTLTLQLDPSLAVTTVDALDYLENFPHQCIEQTVSRFLPNVITYRALQSLGQDDPDLEANLRAALDFGLRRLAEAQNLDGGWGWFQNMESSPYITAYALLGLIEARQSGYDVNLTMLERAIPVIMADINVLNADSDPWLLNRQAFYFYVLSRHENPTYHPSQADVDALFDLRLEMNLYAQAFLLMTYVDIFPSATDQIEALKSDLVSQAKLSATGAHWEEAYTDWWNWNTDTRSTAVVLMALIKADPSIALLPNAVRWLMVARRGTHWETTQDTTWSVMALTDWMVSTNELQGNYDYTVRLNGDDLGAGQVRPDTVREGQTLVVEVQDLLLDDINRVAIGRGEGEGALYYTAHLRLRLDASQVTAIDRGVKVERQYFLEDGTTPVTEATAGDILTVRLTVTVPETIYYFVLEDPLPAGLEPLDTSLLTTTRAVDGPQLQPERNPYYWWYWWIWDHTEMRDESVNLYADELYPGTYVYSYQVQAITPGRFQTMPSHAYAFYFPEVFGRTEGLLFTVNPGE
jgi:hypothetical protein